MNEDALEILNYLPHSFKTQQEQDYIKFLWETFETNYENKKYQFAFLAYHMLFMSFVYFNIWQIRMNKEKDFEKALVGFNKDIEKEILEATSPFTFHRVNESGALRFFKLIGCNNQKVGEFSKIVKDRNSIAHSNGNIFFNNQESADQKINDMLSCVKDIQEMTKSVIIGTFTKFLEDNWNKEDREFTDDSDQIKEILIHKHYFSQEDIKFCFDFDIASLSENDHFTEIKNLFDSFVRGYKEE